MSRGRSPPSLSRGLGGKDLSGDEAGNLERRFGFEFSLISISKIYNNQDSTKEESG